MGRGPQVGKSDLEETSDDLIFWSLGKMVCIVLYEIKIFYGMINTLSYEEGV